MSTEAIPVSLPAPQLVSDAHPAERAAFIRQAYGHLAAAILGFTLLELVIFQTSLPGMMLQALAGLPFSWLLVLGAFTGVSWLATRMAASESSMEMQYVGLALYVVAETVIFIPLLAMALLAGGSAMVMSAAVMSVMLFTGLTVTVYATGHDFQWMKPLLCVGGFVSLGLIICGVVVGFQLGVLFSAGMILLAAGAILYDTSNVLRHYRTDQPVAAALSLFASVALLFWYVLRLMIQLQASGDD